MFSLIGGSGRVGYAQSRAIVNDPLTDPSVSAFLQGQFPDSGHLGGLFASSYSEDGFHLAINLAPTVPSGFYLLGNANLAAALQAGGARANQSIEVDVTQVDGGSDNAYGVACRVTDAPGPVESGYVLWVGSDGTAGIWKVVPDGSGSHTWAFLAHTDIPADTSYHLRADCNGNQLRLFVNGAKVAEAEDGDITAGTVGLFVNTNEAMGIIDVAFTNLAVSRP